MKNFGKISNISEAPIDYDLGQTEVFTKAHGSYIYTKTRSYIDLNNGKGSVILGHNDAEINQAVIQAINNYANIHTGPTEIISMLSDLILHDYSVKEGAIAYYTTGTSACRAAVSVAMECSGKSIVLSAGYHGWDIMWKASNGFLLPNDYGVVDFYFVPSLLEKCVELYKGKIALIIFSPDYVYLKPETIQKIVEIAKKENILVCCDDVKQGYRYRQGASISPSIQDKVDLYTASKGLANGYRLSCLIGNNELLKCCHTYTYTSFFDTIQYHVAYTTLTKMREIKGYDLLNKIGKELSLKLNILFRKRNIPIVVLGSGPMFQFVSINDQIEDVFHRECFRHGIIIYEGDNQAVSCSMNSDVIDDLLNRMSNVCDGISYAIKDNTSLELSSERIFKSAWNMMDGAADIGNNEDKLRWIHELI